ncbi:MAG: transcriptional regulator [Bacteroidetes bacterium GWE2_41_25]|nr:MAG: transcriptional regulator [Bacteroidetes bacterium GWA2_40_15]OFX95834.1 MAG: transcriptional regulator [Bacteroidetes bacterium GWC2_40_22]OFY11356.1 MAG: transcriptional regulator [Bacteroidetes bacterium GWE2_41_25]OFY61903.1 MAG: transcriptional regulator [Bacteroidetes bacterium GWF2_41_9]HAM10793.1 transcriptional regulator [Bacteroidales bacterium]
MRDIQMVDLKAQYERIGPEIDTAIKSVLDSTAFIKGPDVRLFEEELQQYMGVRHVVSCANGTDALYLAMMVLGLEPGDEIITTDFTFIATVEVVALLGLKLVLVDPDPGTFNISAEAIRKAITPGTKAIVPVHLFGQCADMESIMELARDHDLYVIEDAAQATGADYIFRNGSKRKAGTIGHIGTTSFFPSKNLGCYGDGGALYTNDDNFAGKLRSIANHGMKVRYHYDDIGVNSRLDTIQAAILRVKLKYLTQFNESRRAVADFYDEAFKGLLRVTVPQRTKYSSHIFHQYTIRVKNGKRDELKKYLESMKIPAMVYYPGPLHMQEAYRYLGYNENDLPVTTSLCKEVLSLPMHPEMDQEQLDYIAFSINSFFDNSI